MRADFLNITLVLAALLAGLVPASAEQAAPAAATAALSEIEDIYILRSVRESRLQPPTEACATARTKVTDPAWEDQYTFRAVATRAADGRVVDAVSTPVGSIRACFGKTADPAIYELYGDLVLHGLTAKGFGKCTMTKADFPEPGLKLFGCNFELTDLPAAYLGGQLTTNSMTSKQLFGTASEPAGYTQVSIATVRLWRKRAQP